MNIESPSMEELKVYIENKDYEAIYSAYHNFIYFIIYRYGITGLPTEDLFQIGCIGLIKAVNTFDLSKEMSFTTYAGIVIKNEILLEIRKNKKHMNDVSYDELKEIAGFDFPKEEEGFNKIEDKELLNSLYQVINRLTDRDKTIIMDFINKIPQRVTAKKIDYANRLGVGRRLQKILIQLRKEIGLNNT